MRTLMLAPVATVAVLWLAPAMTYPSASQLRPNFTGKWIAVPSPEDTASCSLGSPLTLTQDTQSLTAEWVSNSRSHAPVKLVYNFDGAERRNPELNGSAPHERLTRAVWKEQQLLLTTIWPRENPGAVEITDVLTLTSPDRFSDEMTSRFVAKVKTSTDSTRIGRCTYRRQPG